MASAAAGDDDLTMELECTICKDEYRDPVELKCGHDFCRECLLVYMQRSGYTSHQCPICRVSSNMSIDMVKTMNGNLKLRNIIEALNSNKQRVAICADHNKPYDIYCENCNAAKCVTCFMRLCKNGHTTFELELVAEELRDTAQVKLKQCNELEDELDAKHTDMKPSSELSSVVASLNKLQNKLIQANTKELNSKKERLRAFRQKSNIQLVQAKDEVNKLEVKLPFDDSEVRDLIQDATSKLTTAAAILTSLVGEPDEDEGEGQPPAANSGDAASQVEGANENTVTAGSSASAPSGRDESPRSGSNQTEQTRWGNLNRNSQSQDDEVFPVNNLLQRMMHPFLSYNPMSDFLEIDEYPFGMSPSYYASSEESFDDRNGSYQRSLVTFGTDLVESLARIGNLLYVCTSNGIYSIDNTTKTLELPGLYVFSCCAIDQNSALVATRNEVRVYNMSPSVFCSVRYTLPNSWQATSRVHLVSVGVATGFPLYFFMADVNNACIHVWNASDNHWSPRINTSRYVDSPNPSFRMAVHQDVIYLAFHREGVVIAANLSGTALWEHRSRVSRPNGLYATNSYLYVCDMNMKIVKLTHGGHFVRNMLSDELNQAWSVAIVEDRIAVVERFFRHNTQRTPMKLVQYNMNSLRYHNDNQSDYDIAF